MIPAPTLLVIVLHYKGVADTRDCLTSLQTQHNDHTHILVVENGAPDPLDPSFAIDFPWAERLILPENEGWAGGNNAGIRLAAARGHDWVCLLNNDTIIPPNGLARLMETAAILGPCLLHPVIDSYGTDDQPQFDPAIPYPADMIATPVPNRSGAFQINLVSGACLLAPTALFDRIGPIEERFFLLYEDADLGQRAMVAGYQSFIDAAVRIQHRESRSFGGRRTPLKTYYAMRNWLLFQERNLPGWRNRLARPRHLFWIVSGLAKANQPQRSWTNLLRWTTTARDPFAKAIRMGLRDYARRRFGRLNPRDTASLEASPPPSGPR